MKKNYLWMAAMALGMTACTDADLKNEPVQGDEPTMTPSTLTTVSLATFSGDQDRVSYEARSRAEEGSLNLIATIANPDPTLVFSNMGGEGGRNLSATSIFHDDATGKYYITYHVQGNNYNSKLETSIGGAIQVFNINDDGTLDMGDGFRAQSPSEEDFDFNHIYFDRTDQRIIAVGHNMLNGNPKNTNAIIGVFDPAAGTYTYSKVLTNEKDYDDQGRSLGYKDAGDVNCVVRTNDIPNPINGSVYGWNIYFLATRKGMAALHADAENLFQPYISDAGLNYFVRTPGSAKYVAPSGSSSYYGLLYLAEDRERDENGNYKNDLAASDKSAAKIACLSVNTSRDNGLGWIQTWNSPFTRLVPEDDILDFGEQIDLPDNIQPIDGKNTLTILGPGSEIYAALGVNGMYYKNYDAGTGVLKFGNRPVNCIAVDNTVWENDHKGYVYVANGSKLTILDKTTLKEVASYNHPSKDAEDNDIESSANFIHVEKKASGERIVTVAFGQAGVKVFSFIP